MRARSRSGPCQGDALVQTQATGGNGRQAGPRAPELHVCQHGVPLCETEDHGELLLPGDADKGQGRPFPLEGRLVEELEPVQRDGTGRTRVVLDVLEGEAVITQFCLRALVRGLVVIVGQGAHGPDIQLLGPFRQAAQRQVLNQPLAQWGPGSTSCTEGVRVGDVQEVESLWLHCQPLRSNCAQVR
jgi:hypothetical protein